MRKESIIDLTAGVAEVNTTSQRLVKHENFNEDMRQEHLNKIGLLAKYHWTAKRPLFRGKLLSAGDQSHQPIPIYYGRYQSLHLLKEGEFWEAGELLWRMQSDELTDSPLCLVIDVVYHALAPQTTPSVNTGSSGSPWWLVVSPNLGQEQYLVKMEYLNFDVEETPEKKKKE